MRAFMKKHKQGTSVLAGDLNAASDTQLVTNKGREGREAEAGLIESMRAMGPEDTFRAKHPGTQAWTREPTGQLEHVQSSRRIDHIMLTDEVATHLATRTGMHNGYALDSDHFPVVCGIPRNCVGAARHVTPVWSRQKVANTKPAVSVHCA